jgi:hypothetical protein
MMLIKRFFYPLCLIGLLLAEITFAQCPWHGDVPDLQTSCLCSSNVASELSVQCDQVSSKTENIDKGENNNKYF